MQPVTLEPVARIPLQVSRDGSVLFPNVEFAGDTVAVSQLVDRQSSLDLVLWHAPDAALILLVVIPCVLARYVYRVFSRPQRPGRVHCRKCNYELQPASPSGVAGVNAASLCPECSHSTARPVLGRTGVERLVGVTLSGLLGITVCVGVLALFLQKPAWPGARLWPVAVVGDIVPGLRAQKVTDRIVQQTIVSRWRLPAGGQPLEHLDRDARLTDDIVHSVSVSPDARWFVACATKSGGANAAPSVTIIDADAGTRRTISAAVPGCTVTPTLRAFSGDGAFAYVQFQVWDNFAPALTCDAILSRIELATGVRTDIATVSTPMLMIKGTPQMPVQHFVVHEREDGEASWVLFTQTAGYTPAKPRQSAELVMPSADQSLRRVPMTFSGTSFYPPSLTADGGTLIMDLYGTSPAATLTVDLASGAAAETPSNHTPGMLHSQAAGLVVTPFAPGTPPGAAIAVADATTGVVLVQLSGHASAVTAQLSPNGRWAWVTDVTGPPAGGLWRCSPFNHTKATLLVWDLSGLSPGSSGAEAGGRPPP